MTRVTNAPGLNAGARTASLLPRDAWESSRCIQMISRRRGGARDLRIEMRGTRRSAVNRLHSEERLDYASEEERVKARVWYVITRTYVKENGAIWLQRLYQFGNDKINFRAS